MEYTFLLFVIIFIFTIYLSIKNMLNIYFSKDFLLNRFLFVIILSIFQFVLVELLVQNNLSNIFRKAFILNFFIYFIINFVFIYLNKYYKPFVFLLNLFYFIYGTLQYYVYNFRGKPILPTDIKSIKTAVSVAGNYKFSLTLNIIIGFLFVVFINFMIIKLIKLEKINNKKAILPLIVFIIIFTYVFSLFSDKSKIDNETIVYLWHQKTFSDTSGSLFTFLINLSYMYVDIPDGYSDEKIRKIEENIIIEEKNESLSPDNIFIILEESLVDLQDIVDLDVNMDYMPFLRTLNENTIKGKVSVSSFAGNTCNSEFELLTGNSMGFLPAGSVPFQQYINKPIESLVSILNEKGYTTISNHPYYKDSWDRYKIYPYFGFDKTYFIDNYEYDEIEYIRNYTSDKTNFEKIIEIYENKKQDEKLFIWNITLQNHAGYDTEYKLNTIQDKNFNSDEINEYLSLIYESDKAIETLIKYFSNVNEKTLILILGDHYPGLTNETYADILGKDLNSLSYQEKLTLHQTPFVLWANYDIEEKSIENISLNYMSSLLMDVASLTKTKYQTFLSNMYNKYPIIIEFGFLKDDIFNSFENGLSDNLKEYNIYQHYNIFKKEAN